MTATVLLDPMEREHPRLTSAEIDDRLLIEDFKVKPCPFGADCKQGPAKCLLLHPGEKGRRDPRRFLYSADFCPRYSPDGGSCPEGDGCSFAHGVLERRFHPSRYSYKTLFYLDLEDYLAMEDIWDEKFHAHRADAGERAAIELILDLKGSDLICEYEPCAARLVDDHVPVSLILTKNDRAMALTACDAICERYSFLHSVTGAPIAYGNAFTLKNVQPMLVPASGGCSGPPQGPFNSFYNGSNKLLLKHIKVIAVTPAEERVEAPWAQPQLLSAIDAPLLTVGSSVPKDPDSGRIRFPIYFDSGASVHVVGDEGMLQGYQVLAEPWQIAVGDGRPLVVVGIGIISQDSFIVPNVFHVDGLIMNLISVSQLDREHGLFSGFHDGICKILKRGGDVVGGGFLLANGLYALSFLQVPETENSQLLQAPETQTGEEARLANQAM